MGLFNRRKNIGNTENNKEIYSIKARDCKNEIMMFNIEQIGYARHRDGEKTNIFIARIIKYNLENTISFNMSDYIGFELPVKMKPNDQAMQLVMSCYDTIRSQYNSGYYIGRIYEENGKYGFGQTSCSVQDIVFKQFEKSRQLQQEKYKQKQANRAKREEIALEVRARKYIASLNQTRRNRIMNPTLSYVGEYEVQGKNYEDYNGVNMDTGDILRLRKVNKVGIDGSGTYLYSGYVNSVANEYDAEFFDLDGYAKFVCFELETCLENIIQRGDKEEIRTVLNLFSNINRSNDENVYIGKVDGQGDIIRRDESDSFAIRMQIEGLKREYKKR